MNKSKKVLSLVMALLLAFNMFAIAVSAADTADYYALNAYINTSVPSNNDAGIYSQDSMAALEQVLNSINYDLTSVDKEIVNGYLADVKAAVANLVADETKATAAFSITTSKSTAHPDSVVDVYVAMDTNYKVFAASAAVLYDKNVFEIVADPGSSVTSYFDTSIGSLANYAKVGNYKLVQSMYSRNNNPDYWKAQTKSVGIAYLGFAGNSSLGDPAMASGNVAKFSLRVKSDVEVGATGYIMMNSDWNKTADCAGGLNFVSRTIGDKFGGGTAGAVSIGKTIDLSSAEAIVTVGHEWSDWTVTLEPTCTEDGIETRTCLDCDETETRAIPALGHDYVAVVTPPTCTEQGFTTYTCSRCGDSYVADYTDALDHSWGEWEVTLEPTCTEEGVETRICTVDGAEETRVVPALGHTAGEWEVVIEATCTEDGEQVKKCTVCGEILDTAVIPALGHDYVAVVTAPTCTEEGFTTYTCSRCGDSYVADYTDALGHTWGEWVVVKIPNRTEFGSKERTCTVCGEIETVTIDRFDMSEAFNPVRATITTEGNTITIKSFANASPNFTFSAVEGHTVDVVLGDYITTASGGRYVLSSANAALAGDRVETKATINGYEYDLVLIYDRISFSADELQLLYTHYATPVAVDKDNKVITINSKIGGKYIDFYNVSTSSGAFTYEVVENEFIDKYTTYRYKISKPLTEDMITSTMTVTSLGVTETYELVVNFIPEPFNPILHVSTLGGTNIELKTVNGVESLLLTKDATRPYIGVKTGGILGSTLDFEIAEGMQVLTTSAGVEYIRVDPTADESDVVSSITITTKEGRVVTYPLVFKFRAAEFTVSAIRNLNLDIAASTYDDVANTMTLIGASDAYVRIYKVAVNGITLDIDVDKYPFVTELTSFYQIDKSKLNFADSGIASFEIYVADEDRTIATEVVFPTNGNLSADLLNNTNSTITVDGDVLTATIAEGKTFMVLYKALLNGSETLTVTSSATIEDRGDSYIIRRSAIGSDTTITISGVTYTLIIA